MATLIDVLNEMLKGRETYMELTGGLRLQYKTPTEALPTYRLLCYRVANRPSDRELVTVRQHLEKLLPAGTKLTLGPEMTYTGRDGRARTGRPFSWVDVPAQASLFGGAQ